MAEVNAGNQDLDSMCCVKRIPGSDCVHEGYDVVPTLP
jgi:hypothetical protein